MQLAVFQTAVDATLVALHVVIVVVTAHAIVVATVVVLLAVTKPYNLSFLEGLFLPHSPSL